MSMPPSRRVLPLAVITALVGLTACGGGGGGGGDGVTDSATPSVAVAVASSGEVARSVDTGVSMRLAVTATDDVGVTGVSVSITPPGGSASTTSMVYDATSGTWRTTTTRIPPIAGYDDYAWTATASDASGKTASVSGTFRINGPTPPSTGGAF